MNIDCPHCHRAITLNTNEAVVYVSNPNAYQLRHTVLGGDCPSCGKPVLYYRPEQESHNGLRPVWTKQGVYNIWPMSRQGAPVSPHVPKAIATSFIQARAVLQQSPMASAALSRRCLQHVIRDCFQITKHRLVDEISELSNRPEIPSGFVAMLQAVRKYGNFAAHPATESATGEIVEVESGEAEWLLEILEELLDIAYVKPAGQAARLAKLQQKSDLTK
jgi:hypothetical protein